MLSRVKVKYLGVVIPFLLIFLMSHNTFAVEYHSWLNIQDISKTNLSNDWISHNTPNAGSYSVNGSTSLETYRLSASANLSSQVSGGYFSFSGDIFLDVPNDLSGGVICSTINDAKIVPENVSFNVTSSSLTSCVESNPNIYLRRYTLHIVTNGTISSGSPSSFFFSIGNTSNQTIISLVGTPNNSPRVFISGDININLSNSPELQALDEINQNIVIVSQDLQDLSSQMQQNTQSIIDNQNQNTQQQIESQKVCNNELIDKNDIVQNGYFNSNGSIANSDSYGITNFIDVENMEIEVISEGFGGVYSIYYNENKEVIGSILNTQITETIIPPTGTKFMRFTIRKNNNKPQLLLKSCKNGNQALYDQQQQADENISNQSTSDINGAENQATTNLIGVLSNFLTQLQSFSATDCNLSLPFPSFIGGTQVVNICQGKDVLGNFITIIGTLAMVTFYIPLALVLLKMIYNEIRSFTNG